jgi:cytochrome c-type biogenesis protein CcmH/NrfG
VAVVLLPLVLQIRGVASLTAMKAAHLRWVRSWEQVPIAARQQQPMEDSLHSGRKTAASRELRNQVHLLPKRLQHALKRS